MGACLHAGETNLIAIGAWYTMGNTNLNAMGALYMHDWIDIEDNPPLKKIKKSDSPAARS